jgi:hypothetical protein
MTLDGCSQLYARLPSGVSSAGVRLDAWLCSFGGLKAAVRERRGPAR